MTFQKRLAVLGSTGSIGRQCLEVVEQHPEKFNIQLLSGNNNLKLLLQQCEKFNPDYVIIENVECFNDFKKQSSYRPTQIVLRLDQLKDCLQELKLDLVVNALPSIHGLIPSKVCLENGISLALANKESMLIAGDYLNTLAIKNKVEIIPIDSEISTIYQCLKGERKEDVFKIWLTASGGPLYSKNKIDENDLSVESIVNHPRWEMGPKISVDSATLVNKAFEVYEIYQFFNIKIEKINVVVHPQSQVHSLVEFKDGNIKALVGEPDMKVHISNALSYPQRLDEHYSESHFKPGTWTFETFDENAHPHFTLALNYLIQGGNAAAAFVMCNDFFVKAFLDKKIDFKSIYEQTKLCMESLNYIKTPSFGQLQQSIEDMKLLCEKTMLKSFSTPA